MAKQAVKHVFESNVMELTIVTIGDVNWDVVLMLPKIPGPDEEVALREVIERPGGDAANVAVACAQLGVSAGIVGAVGKDLVGRELLKHLRSFKVNTQRVLVQSQNTGRAYSLVELSGQRRLVYFRGANGVRSLNEDDFLYLRAAKWIYIADPLPSTIQTMKYWYRQGKLDNPLALDPGSVGASRGLQFFSFIAPHLKVLLLNEVEAKTLTKISSLRNAALRLLELAPIVVIKRGQNGSLTVTRSRVFETPAFKVAPKDTTGCGDAFNGAFLTKVNEGCSLEEAAHWGNAAGAIVAQRVGAGQAMPTRKEVEKFLRTKGDDGFA